MPTSKTVMGVGFVEEPVEWDWDWEVRRETRSGIIMLKAVLSYSVLLVWERRGDSSETVGPRREAF